MYYSDVLKLCGFDDSDIQQEQPRIDETFRILGLGPEDMKHAEDWIRESYDIELAGVRKNLGVWIRTLVDLVLGRKEGKTLIYYAFPSIGGLGFTTSLLGGENTLCICPEFVLLVALGGILDKIDPILEAGEENAIPPARAMCGLNKIRAGSLIKGIIPKPDCLLASSFFCDQGPKTDDWLKEALNIPWVITDNVIDSYWGEYPSYKPERVSYLGTEINETFDGLMEVLGKQISESDWAIYNERHGKFVSLLQKINDLMRADPIPMEMGSLQLVRLCRNGVNLKQFPLALEAMETLIPEMEQRVAEGKGPVPKGSPRVYSCLFPPRDTSLIRLIEGSGIAVPVTFLTYDAPLVGFQSSYPTIGEKRAELELWKGLFHSTSGFLHWVKQGCRDWNLDGVIWTWANHCRPWVLSAFTFKKAIEEELGIPVLSLELDWWDNRTYSAEAMRTRIETFAQLLNARKASVVK